MLRDLPKSGAARATFAPTSQAWPDKIAHRLKKGSVVPEVRIIIAAIAAAVLGGAIPAGAAEPAPTPRQLVGAIETLIDANYVIVPMRPALKSALEKSLAAGRYDGLDPRTLSDRITDDMGAVAHDKHLSVRFAPDSAGHLSPNPGEPDAAALAYFARQDRAQNYGVTQLRILDGNVRVMTYDGFMWDGAESAAAIDNAMDFLRGGDAVIIDIRRNGGGSPDASAYLASYFIPPGQKLVTFYLRNDRPTTSSSVKVHGQPLKGIPVYVLTSGFTASAAEEFTSHVARLKFATLVGQTTAGAAHRNEIYPLPGGYVISISIGRPELPGGGNWEGIGVTPQIAVTSEAALDTAHAAALGVLAAKAPPQDRARFERLQAGAWARAAPATPALALERYAGRYGTATVTVEGDHLVATQGPGSEVTLLTLAPDLFAADIDPTVQMRFVVDKGEATALEIMPLEGPTARMSKG